MLAGPGPGLLALALALAPAGESRPGRAASPAGATRHSHSDRQRQEQEHEQGRAQGQRLGKGQEQRQGREHGQRPGQTQGQGLWAGAGGCGCAGPGAPGHRDSALGPRPRPARSLRSPSAGLCAQPRLQEAGGGQRAPGDSVTLSCRGSGFTFEDYYIYWYRQAPGGSPEWVSFISSPKGTVEDYGAAVQGRANMSRDNSRSEAYLSLWSLQAQDSARYFCAVPRGQELQMSFNTNLLRPSRGCLRCREGESCQGLEPMGLKAVSKKSGAIAVYLRYSWPLLHTAGLLLY
ncbi:uncharacterized protein LOC143695762 [Agelaius phoeniceus]|uniref:uncharacterized protein LOC143695762 n=1 Tax=Agelaius phoeniceus TaxID=39638 RepID=UPI0040553033